MVCYDLDYFFDKNHFPTSIFIEVMKFFLSPEKLQFCSYVICAYQRQYIAHKYIKEGHQLFVFQFQQVIIKQCSNQ